MYDPEHKILDIISIKEQMQRTIYSFPEINYLWVPIINTVITLNADYMERYNLEQEITRLSTIWAGEKPVFVQSFDKDQQMLMRTGNWTYYLLQFPLLHESEKEISNEN
jgi:hypothetical protein